MGDGVMSNNRSAVLNAGTSVAAFSVERVAGSVAGNIVQPVVWIIDYGASGSSPDEVDVGLYGLGVVGGAFLGFAAAVTGVVKGIVDDDTRTKLTQIRNGEPAQYRQFIGACVDYSGWAGQTINAMTIASLGGTAWQHPNGLWAFIVDARGRPVADYVPAHATNIYQPVLPLTRTRDGYRWHQV